MRRIKSILILLLACVSGFAQTPFFKDLQVSPEITDLKINSIYQDKDHLIWIGTSKGAYKYDGYNFTIVPGSDSVSSPSVNAIIRDSKKRLWIGYEDGEIYSYYKNAFSPFKFEEGFPKVAITSFAKDTLGNIWFGTYGEGIYLFDGKRLYNYNTDDGMPDNFVYCIAVNKRNEIWCGTDEGIGICKWVNNKKEIRKFTLADGLPDNIVRCIRPAADRKMWIGMEDKGICSYNSETQKFEIPENVLDWKYGEVSCIALLNNKEMWVGTEKSGIVDIELFDNKRVRTFDRSSGLPSNKINKLLLDIEGNIWIASGNKVVFSVGEKLEFLEAIGGKTENEIQSILHRENNELWVSTSKELWKFNLDESGNSSPKKVFEKNELGGASILTMYEDEMGNIWLGTFGQGVYYYNPETKKLKHILEKDGLSNNNVLSIDGKGNEVWFGTLGGVSHCLLNDKTGFSLLKSISQTNGLNENYVYNVFIDSKNRVWFATDGNGITVYNDSVFIRYGSEVGLKSNVIYSITEDINGTIWFSTLNAGIYSFDGKKFTNYSLKEGLSQLEVTSLKADNSGNIIIVHNNGIDVLERKTKKVLSYGYESGIGDIDPNLNASTKDKHGNIWIGTKTGIIKVHLPQGTLISNPKTIINNVKIYLNNIDNKKHVFTYRENHISFDYVGLYYMNPEKVTYEYKLEGYNNEWIHTHDRFITFPNLRPAKYVFKLRSSIDNNYSHSKITSYSFTIQNPFWAEAWFYIAMILLLLTLIYFIFRIREKSYKRIEQQKKERIEFQFETLKAQINPHFLFNSFNTLAALIEEDQKLAVHYVDKLSDFYRSILSYKDVDLISLKEEWELGMNYLYLLEQRHGKSLNFIQGNFVKSEDLLIPPLSLQILIENAVKHNIISKDKPLTIEISMENENTLVIQNNLQLKSVPPPSTKIGLGSISERLKLSGGEPIEVVQTKNQFIVKLILIKKNKSHENSTR